MLSFGLQILCPSAKVKKRENKDIDFMSWSMTAIWKQDDGHFVRFSPELVTFPNPTFDNHV